MSELKTNKVSPATGTALAVGDSGDTITIPSGATLTVDGSLTLPDDSVTTAKILDNNVTLAKLDDGTQGDILYYAASGAPTRLPKGSGSQTLKMNSGATAPEWVTVTSGFTDSCSIGMSSDGTAVNNTTLDPVLFDVEVFDTNGSMANLTNNRIDIQNEGYYICGASIQMNSGGAGVERTVYLYWYDYSATTSHQISRAGYGYVYSGGFGQWHAIALLFLGVNDQLTAKCFQNSGGNLTVEADRSRLWATRIE